MRDLRVKFLVFFLLLAGIGSAFFFVPEKRPLQSYIQRAEEAFQKKNFNNTDELYLKALKAYPNTERTPEILLAIGDTYNFSLGNIEKAGKAYEMLTSRFPKVLVSKTAFQNAGEMYEKNDQYESALLSYQGILDNFPGASDLDQIRFKVAMMALKLKKFEPARRSLMAIIENNPDTPIADQVLYQLGTIFFMEGSLMESVKVLEVAVDKYPQSPLNTEMKFTLANGYEEIGSFDKALKIYQNILTIYPNPKVIDKKIEKLKGRLQESKNFKQEMLAKGKAESQPHATPKPKPFVRKRTEDMPINNLPKLEGDTSGD